MVDVGDKPVTRRVARAGARVWMAERTLALLEQIALPKGDVLAVARVAGIQAAKRTAELIPMCHPLSLTHVELAFTVHRPENRVDIECIARTDGKTGVEMEALTGASVAALTIYDMCKAVDRGMVVGDVRLLEKTGGKEDYVRPEGPVIGEAAFVAADPGAPALPKRTAARSRRRPGWWAAVVSVNVSPGKGERKKPVERVSLRAEHGIEGDGHAGPWHRQVSLLAQESIDTMVAKGLDVGPGDFAENITTRGVELYSLPVGTRLRIGEASGGTHADRQGLPRPLCHLLSGGRLRHAARGHLRARAGGRHRGSRRYGSSFSGRRHDRARSCGRPESGPRLRSHGEGCAVRIRAAVVTVSDKGHAGIREDASGPVLRGLLEELGAEVAADPSWSRTSRTRSRRC